MYRGVCLDLDGTLVDDGKRISPFNLKILRRLRKKGMEIIIATGRGLSKAREMTLAMDFPFTIIANNGAIVEEAPGKILLEQTVSKEIVDEVYNEGRKRALLPYLYIIDPEKSLLLPENAGMDYHRGSVADLKELEYFINYEKVPKVLSIVYIDDREKLLGFEKAISQLDIPCSTHLIRAFDPHSMIYEIQNPRATKDRAIDMYLNRKGLSMDQMIAIGDDNNDIRMIRKAGLGIAMVNGTTEIKEKADLITEFDNNQDGVGKVLKKVFDLDKKIYGVFGKS
ncbi:MAG: Cof-type HAD-IIB family hydrolase [Tissierellia bacterium]|nr:Cof-type HAD-IIB family hydrolase [Tissierellia bacterium]